MHVAMIGIATLLVDRSGRRMLLIVSIKIILLLNNKYPPCITYFISEKIEKV